MNGVLAFPAVRRRYGLILGLTLLVAAGVAFVDPDTRDISVFLRVPFAPPPGQAVPDELVFELDDQGRILDTATGSVRETVAGAATAGPLTGAILQRLPYVTSYDWAWGDFFPYSTFYGDEG